MKKLYFFGFIWLLSSCGGSTSSPQILEPALTDNPQPRSSIFTNAQNSFQILSEGLDRQRVAVISSETRLETATFTGFASLESARPTRDDMPEYLIANVTLIANITDNAQTISGSLSGFVGDDGELFLGELRILNAKVDLLSFNIEEYMLSGELSGSLSVNSDRHFNVLGGIDGDFLGADLSGSNGPLSITLRDTDRNSQYIGSFAAGR